MSEKQIRHYVERPPSPILTKRQKQVFDLLVQGKRHKEIMSDLNIGFATVREHCRHIYRKAGLPMYSGTFELLVKCGTFDWNRTQNNAQNSLDTIIRF